jgi:hypothetical protein
MTPTALIFVVCRAFADQGPLDVNGFPVDGVRLDDATCRNEVVEMYDAASAGGYGPLPDFSNPYVCSRMSLVETGHWESLHPGWYVKRVKCPRPDGTFPGDLDV